MLLNQCLRRQLPTPILQCTRSFHPSQSTCGRVEARREKKLNLELHQTKREEAQAQKAHPVTGCRPGEENKWAECDLAKLIVTPDQIIEATKEEMSFELEPLGAVKMPKYTAWGVSDKERSLLFRKLPLLGISSGVDTSHKDVTDLLEGRKIRKAFAQAIDRENKKLSHLNQLLDLRNADQGGIHLENRQRIVKAFSGGAKRFDPGRTEVQVALLTYQIRNLWSHLTHFKRDVANRRGLRILVHKRAKLFKYLRSSNFDRYETLLARLGMERESVEGEIIF